MRAVLHYGSFIDPEALGQRVFLTQFDLSIPLGVCISVVSKYVKELHQEEKLLPPRRNIYNLSGVITHKNEIITLYLDRYLISKI